MKVSLLLIMHIRESGYCEELYIQLTHLDPEIILWRHFRIQHSLILKQRKTEDGDTNMLHIVARTGLVCAFADHTLQ